MFDRKHTVSFFCRDSSKIILKIVSLIQNNSSFSLTHYYAVKYLGFGHVLVKIILEKSRLNYSILLRYSYEVTNEANIL